MTNFESTQMATVRPLSAEMVEGLVAWDLPDVLDLIADLRCELERSVEVNLQGRAQHQANLNNAVEIFYHRFEDSPWDLFEVALMLADRE